MFLIPKFDETNSKHLDLAQISKQCHERLKSQQFTRKNAAGTRSEARKVVAKEIEKLDELVSELLGL